MVEVVKRAIERVRPRPRHRVAVLTVLVSILYWVLSSGYGILANTLGVPYTAFVNPAAAVPFVLGVMLGTSGAWAILYGYSIMRLVTMTAGVETVFVALAHGYLAYAGFKLSGATVRPDHHRDRPLSRTRQRLAVFGVVVVAAAGAAATIAWGYEVAGIGPFYVTVMVHFVEYALSTLIFGLPVLAVLGVLISRGYKRPVVTWPWQATRDGVPVRSTALVTLAWIGIGGAISIGFRVFERIPRAALFRRDLEVLLVFRQSDIVGVGAGRVLVLLGGIIFPVLLWGIASNYRWREESG